MRVPVRLGAEGPRYYGPRHAPLVNVTRRAQYYGGDIRRADPLSLVFRGNLGSRLADDLTLTLDWPSDAAPAIDPSGYSLDIGAAPLALDTSWLQSFELPAYTAPSLPTASPSQIFGGGEAGAAPAGAPAPAWLTPDTSSWWQTTGSVLEQTAKVLPAIIGAGAAVTTAVVAGQRAASPTQQVYNPATGQMVTVPRTATPVSYTIPATATQPAQRVTYNPATGQVSTVPLTGLGAVLPSFLQAAPGAPWYQNPLVWVGASGGLLLLVLVAGRR